VEDGYAQYFGEQPLLDARGAVLGHETLALAAATPFDVTRCVALVHRHGGLAVAAHVDRPHFGVIGQLGVFPHEAGFDAVEVSRHVATGTPEEAAFAAVGLPLLRSSDAHYLADVGAARTALAVTEPGFVPLAALLRAGATAGGGRA
jgi:hypothetical protein